MRSLLKCHCLREVIFLKHAALSSFPSLSKLLNYLLHSNAYYNSVILSISLFGFWLFFFLPLDYKLLEFRVIILFTFVSPVLVPYGVFERMNQDAFLQLAQRGCSVLVGWRLVDRNTIPSAIGSKRTYIKMSYLMLF